MNIYFLHGDRIVRGSVKRKINQHRVEVIGEHYMREADGGAEEEPIYLGFTRSLSRVDVFPTLAAMWYGRK